MKRNHLVGLTLVAAVAVAGAIGVSVENGPHDAGDEPSASARLFPDLASHINDVGKVIIARKDATITLVKTATAWGVAEKYNYPADFEKVRKLLVNLTELRPLEKKTSTPALFADLQLEDLSTPDAKSVLLTLQGADGKDLLATYVGKERFARGGAGSDGVYIRKASETQTWLAKGALGVEQGAVNWLDKSIADVAHERVAKVTVTQPDGTALTLSRDKVADAHFTLADIPKGKKAKEWDIDQVAAPLEGLQLDDVMPAKDVPYPAGGKSGSAELTTFDGLTVHVDLLPKDKDTWLHFQASYKAPGTAPSDADMKAGKLKKPEDVQKEAAGLNAKAKDWVYKVPDWKLDNLRKKAADLVEDDKKDEKKKS
jgi:Domain of unknown function (DUF4340)